MIFGTGGQSHEYYGTALSGGHPQVGLRERGGKAAVCGPAQCEQGGKYEMTIRYVPKADRKLEVCVNNEKRILLDSLSADETQKIASITVPVHLKAGYNKVRMGSSFCWAPDIDCFTLTKVSE